MVFRRTRRSRPGLHEHGQASLMVVDLLGVLGARGEHQRAAGLAAVSAAPVMRRQHTRLFQDAYLEDGRPNPRHLSNAAYLALARAAAAGWRSASRAPASRRPA